MVAAIHVFIVFFKIISFGFVVMYTSRLIITAWRDRNPRLLLNAMVHAVMHTVDLFFMLIPILLDSVVVDIILTIMLIRYFIK